jgi:hypothetical protein
MKAQVVRGSKEEIAETIVRISGKVREAIVFIEEPSDVTTGLSGEDIFAEVEPFTVRADNVDYLRESLYIRMEGE